jgi:hypothetical protein
MYNSRGDVKFTAAAAAVLDSRRYTTRCVAVWFASSNESGGSFSTGIRMLSDTRFD